MNVFAHSAPLPSSNEQARLAGPELMSYGTGSGRVYFSDLTFAFLEDTNQCVTSLEGGY